MWKDNVGMGEELSATLVECAPAKPTKITAFVTHPVEIMWISEDGHIQKVQTVSFEPDS